MAEKMAVDAPKKPPAKKKDGLQVASHPETMMVSEEPNRPPTKKKDEIVVSSEEPKKPPAESKVAEPPKKSFEEKPKPTVVKDKPKPDNGDFAIEKGFATNAEIAEVDSGTFLTAKEVASKLRLTRAWIIKCLQTGRIHGIKPTGGQWRIPASEARRLQNGISPLPRKSAVLHPTEILVEGKHRTRVMPQPKASPPQAKPGLKWPLNIIFKEDNQ